MREIFLKWCRILKKDYILAESKEDFKSNVGYCCILIIVRFYFLCLEQLTFRRSTANSRVDGEY